MKKLTTIEKVSKIDAYFQNHNDKWISKRGEYIADKYYENTGKGWEGCSEQAINGAYFSYKALLNDINVDEEIALKF